MKPTRQAELESMLTQHLQAPYPIHSRIHHLNSFPKGYYVKRDDELGFGISGSKLRKYRSLIPFLLQMGIQKVIVIGSAYSNHVLGIIQLLIENRIQPLLFLKETKNATPQGNLLLIQLLVPEIHWVASHAWNQVELMAQEYATEHIGQKIFILKEGASTVQALPGALSLPLDMIRNEIENGVEFNHFLVESGTGLMASAAILGLQWLQKPVTVHVLLLADDENFFIEQLNIFHHAFEKLMQRKCAFPNNFTLYKPASAAAFGSTNAEVFHAIKDIARQEGFFVDPIYTGKLFLHARALAKKGNLLGNILINHSGGGLTLTGFQNQLRGCL
jgi:1-aminocyclopropane-1-carboxylate deaminase/D-cysteine desulfhydrase-like pyridoxal-dependent ACC family enzyme